VESKTKNQSSPQKGQARLRKLGGEASPGEACKKGMPPAIAKDIARTRGTGAQSSNRNRRIIKRPKRGNSVQRVVALLGLKEKSGAAGLTRR